MTLDPAAAPLIAMLNTLPITRPPFDVAAFRLADAQPMPIARADIAEVRDVALDGVAARLYHPAPGERLPALAFLHGGGWVHGAIDTHDALARALAARARVAVISIDYPRAPEYPFPAPVEAVHRTLLAIVAQADALGVDASRLAVGGDSAGGNLAAAACLVARDRAGPAIAHQLLIYPVLDADFDSGSYRANGAGYFVTAEMMRWYWTQYLGDGVANPDPLAAPLRAASLAGLPPATIITAEHDVLCDEGEAYAARLDAAGVAVQLERMPGMFHGFASFLGVIPQADAAVDLAAAELRAALVR